MRKLLLSFLLTFVQLAQAINFPLPSGYYVPHKQALEIIYPRPDSETNSWARHRHAYYDGTNSVPYRIPIGVSFGAPPYKYEITASPANMGTCTIGQYYGDENYGVLTCTPIGRVTNGTITVRVMDNESNHVDVTWTVSTSSSTSDFIFVSTTGNDTIGTGSISAPYATFVKIASLSTHASAIFRAGTYTMPTPTAAIIFTAGNGPVSLIGYEGESATLDFSTMTYGHGPELNTADYFVDNLTLSGGAIGAANWKSLYMGDLQDRQTFSRINSINIENGSDDRDNPTTLFFFGFSSGQRNYIYIVDSYESNRPAGPNGNEAGLYIIFSVSNGLSERNTVTNSSAGQGNMLLKSSAVNWTVRYNKIVSVAASQGFATGDLAGTFFANSGQNEWCYNTIVGYVFMLDYDNDLNVPKDEWVYRNTIYGNVGKSGDIYVNAYSTNGPLFFENNVVVWGAGASFFTSSSTGTERITNTGTEAQGDTSAGIIDGSTYLLTGSYRTNWLGKRGAQISDGTGGSGDVNGDHQLTLTDILLVQKYLLGQVLLTTNQLQQADIYPAGGDGLVTFADLLVLQQKILNTVAH